MWAVMSTSSAVHWFRKGLRLHDNPALIDAVKNPTTRFVLPVFCLDPVFLRPELVGVNRIHFLLECLQDLDQQLRQLRSRLFVLRGDPLDQFPAFFRRYEASLLTFEFDTEPYAKLRDERVRQLCSELGIEVRTRATHTLYDPEQIRRELGDRPTPLTYKSFQHFVTETLGRPPASMSAPAAADDICTPDIDLNAYHVPTLAELESYRDLPVTTTFHGGETVALKIMERFLTERKAEVRAFSKPHTSPTAWPKASTTQLSPYFKFGCLSPRLFFERVRELRPLQEPPVSLIGQLWWREFFTYVAYVTPNFHQMRGNPICRQIPWREERDDPLYRAWEDARTGYPWIDACMTQLRTEGWLHHLARHAVACFLTRGDLWISWERGRETFDRLLVDADYSLNNANWLWLSSSAFFHQYYRVYSPISFPQKYDPNGDFVRHFLPVLRDMPAKYIYAPWQAPLAVQQKAKCIIGQDYPYPVVDHVTVSRANMERMRNIFTAASTPRAPKRKREDADSVRSSSPDGDTQGKSQ
jgi:cryptochrome